MGLMPASGSFGSSPPVLHVRLARSQWPFFSRQLSQSLRCKPFVCGATLVVEPYLYSAVLPLQLFPSWRSQDPLDLVSVSLSLLRF
jgi:hypothetical protein